MSTNYMVCNATDSITPDAAEEALLEVQNFLVKKLDNKPVRIYEAGGGCYSFLPLSSLNHSDITVVDADEDQIRRNKYASTKILGDIETFQFPPDSFDLVSCTDVIEHLTSPDQAIRIFNHVLAPGGLLFLGAPNPKSFSGFVTKYSPHWFHVWCARIIFKNKNAGKPGHLPFRTVFHPIVSPKAMRNFCAQLGLEVIYFNLYVSHYYQSIKKNWPIGGWLLEKAISTVNMVTFGRFSLFHGNYYMVLEKKR